MDKIKRNLDDVVVTRDSRLVLGVEADEIIVPVFLRQYAEMWQALSEQKGSKLGSVAVETVKVRRWHIGFRLFIERVLSLLHCTRLCHSDGPAKRFSQIVT